MKAGVQSLPTVRFLGRLSLAAGLALWLLAPPAAVAEEGEWPREIVSAGMKVVMYLPQVESYEGDRLAARAAVSVTRKGEDPVFGAVWFEARTLTDRDTREIRFSEIRVAKLNFPETEPARIRELADLLEEEMPKWELAMTQDQLLAMLDLLERERKAAESLKADPPKVRFSRKPAVLVLFDGDPQLRKVEGTPYMRVVNTPFFVAFDTSTKKYYLKGGETWYGASEALGPWRPGAKPPGGIVKLVPKEEPPPKDAPKFDAPPEIVVSTEPAELVVTDGEPKFTPIPGTDLMFVTNTVSDLFLEVGSQRNYLLLSGRWFVAKSFDGPWTFVPADRLPADFGKIPPESPKGNVRVFVAGTREAKDAVLDAQIPQTAKVKRGTFEIDPRYDGDPRFEGIPGTPLAYAANAELPVIRYGSRFYLCSEGVWYVSVTPKGPWEVATEVPAEFQAIPPEVPVYYVKYVYVYDYTPDFVFVGYYPGYLGCYIWGPTIVYGTGYWYRPWYGPVYYYPRPVTYGFRVSYSSVTGGWYFGFGIGTTYPVGWFSFTVSTGPAYGWWGPAGYRPVYVNVRRPTYVNINAVRPVRPVPYQNVYGRPARPGKARPGNVVSTYERRPAPPPRGRPEVPARPAPGPAQRPARPEAARPSPRPNDVYTDREGNVYRKDDEGWKARDRSGWDRPEPSRTPAFEKNRPDLERQNRARDYGTQRSRQYERSTGGGSPRGGGAVVPRGGGGRMR